MLFKCARRSHAVLQIELVFPSPASSSSRAPAAHALSCSRIALVDLSGSERASDMFDCLSRRERLEAADINQSLLAVRFISLVLFITSQKQLMQLIILRIYIIVCCR